MTPSDSDITLFAMALAVEWWRLVGSIPPTVLTWVEGAEVSDHNSPWRTINHSVTVATLGLDFFDVRDRLQCRSVLLSTPKRERPLLTAVPPCPGSYQPLW